MNVAVAGPALAAGTVLQNYEIVDVLGHGGFGITYLATHRRLDFKVAIKEYMPRDHAHRDTELRVVANTDAASPDADVFRYGLERFLQEAKSLVRFRHPHIVRAQDYFEANGTAYIVMEYAEGETLERWLRKQPLGAVEEERLRSIFLPLLDGLSEVHANHLLHRDIKPANIYLRRDGTPLLIDFGAARSELGATGRSHHVQITPGYSPKEQYASAGRQGPWTDIYSVGAALLRCISGQEPPSALDRAEAFDNAEPDPLPLAAEIGRGRYTESFLNTIDHCLAWDPPRRLQSVRELQHGLLGVRDPGPRGADGKFGPASGSVRVGGETRARSPETVRVAVPDPDATRRVSREQVLELAEARRAAEREAARAPAAAPVGVAFAPSTGRRRGFDARWALLGLVPLVLVGAFLALRPGDPPPGAASTGDPDAGTGRTDVALAPPADETASSSGGSASREAYEGRRARLRDVAALLERARSVVSDADAATLRETEARAGRLAEEGRYGAAVEALDEAVRTRQNLLATSPREAEIGSDAGEIRAAFEACEAHYGRDGCAPSWFEIERERRVLLSPFALDASEVSFADFVAFLDATDYVPTSVERGWSLRLRPDLSIEKLEGYTVREPLGPGSDTAAVADRPVAHVSWYDADAFCRHRGARLPSRAEWEVGADGAQAGDYASYFDPANHRPADVGLRRLATLATGSDALYDPDSGLYGATGNVWEWTSTIDPSHSGGSRRFVKGGSAREAALVNMRLAALRSEYPGDSYIDLGFRCASDLERWP